MESASDIRERCVAYVRVAFNKLTIIGALILLLGLAGREPVENVALGRTPVSAAWEVFVFNVGALLDSPLIRLLLVGLGLVFIARGARRVLNADECRAQADSKERADLMRPLQQLVSCNLETQRLLTAKERLLEVRNDLLRYSERIEQMRAIGVQIWPMPHVDTLNLDAERLAGKIAGVSELLGDSGEVDLRLPTPITDSIQQERWEGHPEIADRFDPEVNTPYFNDHEANATGWRSLLQGMMGQIERGLEQDREREEKMLKEFADAAPA